VAEDHTNDDQQPSRSRGETPKPTKRNPNWDGRRPGAGAPKGNLNGFKHGRRSRQLSEAVMIMAANPKLRDTLVALANRAGLKQAKAEDVAARFFVNAITKGIKIENPRQARAITDLIREMSK
jgi:hypothetical protein